MLHLNAQEDASYKMPPKAIADLIDAPPTPSTSISPDNQWVLLLNRPNLPSLEEVAQEELRIAGIRINPMTNGSSRSSYYNGMKLKPLAGEKGRERAVKGLPENPRIENLSWSPDGTNIVFTNTLKNGMELWKVDVASAQATKLTEAIVNDAMGGNPYRWMPDSKQIIFKSIIADRGAVPTKSTVPSGPIIQYNEGKAAAVRTYQDLLQNKYDETLFDYYASAQLMKMNLRSGETQRFMDPGVINGFSISPDGNYVLVTRIKKPYSYIVPYSRFPQSVIIFHKSGSAVRQIADIPVADNIPKGFGAVRMGPRRFTWRADAPATLYWAEAQDGGDPRKKVAVRDQLFSLAAPFSGEPVDGITFKLRYGGITWGNDNLAIAGEYWWATRQSITNTWAPSNPTAGKEVLFDRSSEDRYGNPGSFELKQNKYGRYVLMTADEGKTLFLRGQGASPEGNRPFVDEFDLATKKTKRLWRSEAPYYEISVSILDEKEGIVLTRRESNHEAPNYFLRNLKTGDLKQITHFPNPFEALNDVQKEFIKYKRADGVELTGTLYLPPGYDKERDGRLPVMMWAYPREYKSASAASQVSDSPYEFIRVGWWSPILWVLEGYAVFDDFGMPIIGEGEEEPNETFVEQLTSGAEAAINTLVEKGVADADRLVVGGHSYGAFMTANLMAHTDLFAAGIARSGAYNRTLTPFGFQAEQRTFWEAPEIYFKMSPFMHADKITEPLLLIHGEADNNSGTFPMQSKRFYAALKGHGATVRLCMLPHESHGYRARESIMHMAWEMNDWIEKHVKNKKEKEVKP